MNIVEITLPGDWNNEKIRNFISLNMGSAACVHRYKIISSYQWKGEIVDEEEWMVRIKIPKNRLKELVNKINDTHPYDIPMINILKGDFNEKYEKWAENSRIDNLG